jgi:hypothetical protein
VLVERAVNKYPAANPGEIRAFSKCRNERLRLPAFLKHYRNLGVNRFFIVDNDSSDGSAEYLAGQPDVHLLRTTGRFREAKGGTDWLNAVLAEFGVGAWCITVDIDEWLIYPGSEKASLRSLTDYLDQHGYEAMSCLLLDMYPGGPLRECAYDAGDSLLATAPYFDAGPYKRSPYEACPGVVVTGGMRERVFYPELRARRFGRKAFDAIVKLVHRAERQRSPCLTKVPLVRWDAQSRYVYSTHFVSRKVVAPDTGVLLHFKFLQDFHHRAVQEATRGEYHDEATEYRRYARMLRKNPGLSLKYEGSKQFESTTQLVGLGLMHETDAWVDARAT